MKVASNTPDQLVLEHRPRILPSVVGLLTLGVAIDAWWTRASLDAGDWTGLALGLAVGGFITYLVALPSRVVFSAAKREVCWEHHGWPGKASGCCPFDELEGVQAVVDPDTEGHGERVVLLTQRGRVPLTRHYSGTDPSADLAATIRAWLAAADC